MANTETATTSSVYGQIDSTGAIGTITVKGSKFLDISINYDTGTYVGTIALQRETRAGASGALTWQTIKSYTAGAEEMVQSATTRRYRLNCTADTSGTAYYELTAGNFF